MDNQNVEWVVDACSDLPVSRPAQLEPFSFVGIWFPLRQATCSVSGPITGWMSPERSLILLEHLLNDLLCVATESLNSEVSVDVVSQGNTTLRVA